MQLIYTHTIIVWRIIFSPFCPNKVIHDVTAGGPVLKILKIWHHIRISHPKISRNAMFQVSYPNRSLEIEFLIFSPFWPNKVIYDVTAGGQYWKYWKYDIIFGFPILKLARMQSLKFLTPMDCYKLNFYYRLVTLYTSDHKMGWWRHRSEKYE